MRKLALLVAVAVSLVLAACGSGASSKQSFTADGNRTCAQGQRKLVHLYLDRGLPSNGKEQYEFDKAVVPVRDELLAGLRKLKPPPDLQKAFERYLSVRQRVVDLTRHLTVVDRKGPDAAAEAVRSQIEEVLRESIKPASESGLDVCAVKLSRGHEKAVTDVISEFEVTADPKRACRDLATPQFVNSRFPGGYTQCAAYVKKNAATYAKSVDVTHVEGTNGVLARVEYRDVGGRDGGVASTATLFYLGGRWKIFAAGHDPSGG